MDYWTNHESHFTTSSQYGAHSGSRHFYGGDNNEESKASQYVDVSDYAEAIEDGQVWASFNGWIKAYGDDDGIFEMMFRTSENGEIQYHHASWQSPDNWNSYSIENKKLPNNTRIVEIRMRSDRDAGDDNDGYFDDLCLTLKTPNLQVIEPLPSEGVTLYSATNYAGSALTLKNSDADLSDNSFNDIASSIKVPSGWQVILYQAWYYTLNPLVLTGNDSTLVDNNCNDVVSSVKIEKRRLDKFDFGNVYLASNQSTKDYNYSKKKLFKFKNSGDSDTKLNWDISGPSWVKFSVTSGDLSGQAEQTIEVWLEPTGGTGTYNGTITFISTRGDVDIPVSATAYQVTQLSFVAPEKGANGKVNVAENESVQYEVKANGPFNPEATLAASGYRWKMDTADFGNLSDPKKSHTFQTSGLYDAYCISCEKSNNIEVRSDELEIPIRVWIRPTVSNTPPQSAIDDGLVSWYDNKYIGVRGEPVYLMATGQKGSGEESETITKYIWDFDNDWRTIELEQSPDQVKAWTGSSANLSGSIRCKAVTNYGVKSDEKVFSLRIYETPLLDAEGPYTGKPNKAVELACSINQTAYPGATYQYQWRTGGTETAYSLKGSATQETGYIELTPNEQSKNGQIEYVNLSLGENWSVHGEFWTGGGNGADAFYIYAFATATPTNEDRINKQYSINYDE
ncbi:MAG: peptidase inhibitor family I36 protein, partial [Candidatus Desantisbacteria bacterium]